MWRAFPEGGGGLPAMAADAGALERGLAMMDFMC